jgi:hypothetical protein
MLLLPRFCRNSRVSSGGALALTSSMAFDKHQCYYLVQNLSNK